LERLEPPVGCYLGVTPGAGDTIARLNNRLGLRPAVYGQFFEFPLKTETYSDLTDFLNQVRSTRGIALVTLEPYVGLSNVTEAACLEFARLCAEQENQGIGGIVVRFAHEMNGNWNPWGQQPILFRDKFRRLAMHVHSNTTRTAMLWAPSYGGGYPFGTNRVVAGSPDFVALDTDTDGILSQNDDMYEPYYPGDDAVDWVGLTLYHWGVQWPWLENELPEPNSFADLLTGNYNGGNGNQTAVPDFYARYCANGTRTKPLAIPETAAFFNPHRAGASELAIKRAWLRQLFNINGDSSEAVDIALHFPKLKCVCWFDHYKLEPEQQQWIDWRISAYAPVRSAFLRQVRTLRQGRPWFLTAADFDAWQRLDSVTDIGLPAVLPLGRPVALSSFIQVHTNCDLVAELLDQNLTWRAGARASLAAGTQAVNLTVLLPQSVDDGAFYHWNVFLTTPGGDAAQRLAAYDGLPTVARTITPAIQIAASPPVLTSLSNFVVRVKYTATESAVAVVNLLDGGHNWRGGGTLSVSRGDGWEDVAVVLQPGITSGNYLIECFLSDSSSNSRNPMARSESFPVQVVTLVNQDHIEAIPYPAFLPAGEVIRFLVRYAAVTNRDVHIDLFDAHTNFLAGNVQPVPPGSGVCDMTLSLPDAPPGKYFATAFITPTGQPWTDALAWSSDRRLTLLARDYQNWLESHWGLVMASDPVDPEQDADGDGVNNRDEFIALTNPRDGADSLKTRLTMGAGALTVSWQSAVGRNYQLFRADNLRSTAWVPASSVLMGSGQLLQVPIDRAAITLNEFYRVQVLKP
jgi:hypothetical protein